MREKDKIRKELLLPARTGVILENIGFCYPRQAPHKKMRVCSALVIKCYSMNKKEVAERLGVSTRLVERYSSEGRLGEITYVRGKTGKQADYEEAAVERLKAELEAPDKSVTALAANTRATGLVVASEADRERFITALETIASQGEPSPARGVPIPDKLVLSLKEASALAGISRDRLLAAIESGKLKASKDTIGRGWRVKRVDLELYVVKL
jgi:excisionase family DNA binding protein